MDCLSRGLDDYVLKDNYSQHSLECRILKLLSYSTPQIWEVKNFSYLNLLPHMKELCFKKTRIRLTDFEYTFLNYTIDRQGYCNIKEFQQYLSCTNKREIPKENLVVYINRLKQKIEYQCGHRCIKSKYGEGYYLDI